MYLIPNSNGEDYRPLVEFNQCHAAADGKFCSTSGAPPAIASKKQRPDADLRVQGEANAYNRARGLPDIEHGYVDVDQPRAGAIADAYDALPVDDGRNGAVQRAYHALASGVVAQWQHAVAGGMTFEPWTKDGQPYATSTEMAADVKRGHLYYFTGGDPNPPMAARDPKTGLVINDMFRAIHDYYGHAAGGYGFGPRGEENAWATHSQMFSLEARRALTTETRGQNSWVNFGRQNYDAQGNHKNIPPANRPFATQKYALLPDAYVYRHGERLGEAKQVPPPFVRKPTTLREEDELPYRRPPPKRRS